MNPAARSNCGPAASRSTPSTSIFCARSPPTPTGCRFTSPARRSPISTTPGQLVEPREPNAIKFERFIFDLLPAAERSIVFEVDRAAAFAPLKNADGQPADTPTTVREQMIALHTAWLRSAGAVVEEGVPVEISPLFALDAAELATRTVSPSRIAAPRFFVSPA